MWPIRKRERKQTAAHIVVNSDTLWQAAEMCRYGSLIAINPSVSPYSSPLLIDDHLDLKKIRSNMGHKCKGEPCNMREKQWCRHHKIIDHNDMLLREEEEKPEKPENI